MYRSDEVFRRLHTPSALGFTSRSSGINHADVSALGRVRCPGARAAVRLDGLRQPVCGQHVDTRSSTGHSRQSDERGWYADLHVADSETGRAASARAQRARHGLLQWRGRSPSVPWSRTCGRAQARGTTPHETARPRGGNWPGARRRLCRISLPVLKDPLASGRSRFPRRKETIRRTAS